MKKYIGLLLLLNLCSTVVLSAPTGAPVYVTRAQLAPIYQQVPLTGTVTSANVARLSVAVGGLIQAINVESGSLVAKGDVLLILDDELAVLEARGAAARTVQRQTALKDATRRLREASALEGNIAETTIRGVEAEIGEDNALLQEARAEQAYHEALVERHRVLAPFDGVINDKLGEAGEWVNPGQAVLELVALDRVRLDFKVAEDYLAQVNDQAIIRYSLKAFPGQMFEAPVGTIVPVSDPADRTFLLRVPAPNKEGHLIPGLSISAELRIATGRENVVIPRDATTRTPDGRVIVWTLREDDGVLRAVENLVKTGLVFNGDVEITQGLNQGDQVVIRGNESLQQDQQVYIVRH